MIHPHSSLFHGSYAPDDVTFLLKPARIETTPVSTKEKLIQSGTTHYSEMLSPEAAPDKRYMALYQGALERNAPTLRAHIETLADAIATKPQTRKSCVLISLARAGTPIGVLLKRALDARGLFVHHYSISIIRDRGIDHNALAWIAARHDPDTAIFVDGWTGKGAITDELRKSLSTDQHGFYPRLAVVADPAGCATLAATCEDYTIPSGLLNGIVSGLISRTVLRTDICGPTDFHACQYLEHLTSADISRQFVDRIMSTGPRNPGEAWTPQRAHAAHIDMKALLDRIAGKFEVQDRNRIKPGIAEATRAVLRRVPERVLVRDPDDPEVAPIIHLAQTANVPVERFNLGHYRALTIISNGSDN